VEEVKKEIRKKKPEYPSLSEFVSEAIQLRLRTLAGEEETQEPVALGLRTEEGQIWNMIAQYNLAEEECEYKESAIPTMLADLSLSSSACRLTGIQCSLYTCPRTKI